LIKYFFIINVDTFNEKNQYSWINNEIRLTVDVLSKYSTDNREYTVIYLLKLIKFHYIRSNQLGKIKILLIENKTHRKYIKYEYIVKKCAKVFIRVIESLTYTNSRYRHSTVYIRAKHSIAIHRSIAYDFKMYHVRIYF